MARAKSIAEIYEGAVYVLQAGTPIYIKTADLCAITGKSNQWIGQLTNQGTLFKKATPKGSLYDLRETMRAYCEMLESRIDSKTENDEEIEKTRRASEAALKKAKATIASLEVKERLGQMHRSEDVAAMTEDLIFSIRSALLSLPGRLAMDLINITDSAQASEIVRGEVYKIMEELSNYKYDPARYSERVRARLNLEETAEADE